MTLKFPKEVKGIRIEQKGSTLHFLHSSGWALDKPHGLAVARYIVHYADGRSQTLPVRIGEDIRDWWLSNVHKRSIVNGQLAWHAPSAVDDNREIGLYTKSWKNPWPEAEISSIDFISEMSDGAPFLVALTVE